MEHTKELSTLFSYDRIVTYPSGTLMSLPFMFTRQLGTKEIFRIQEHMAVAPFCPSPDPDINENRQFKYVVFVPSGATRFNRAIILLHGLNERSWDKYLSWAEDLVRTCGVPVVLFPIAFHMNRTPATWYAPRWLQPWLSRRKQEIRNLCNASFLNLALSSRLSVSPLRFYSSGLESAFNLTQLIMDMKNGAHPLFKENVQVDFFAYSIGALLAQVLLMADPRKCLGTSKLFAFCGGSVFERMNGNARDIIDQEAYQKIRNFYLQDFLAEDPAVKDLSGSSGYGFEEAFRLLIPSVEQTGKRGSFFDAGTKRIRMVSLRQDVVIPTAGLYEAVGTGAGKGIVEELDFPYAYTHQTPFPENGKIPPEELSVSFRSVFDRAAVLLA